MLGWFFSHIIGAGSKAGSHIAIDIRSPFLSKQKQAESRGVEQKPRPGKPFENMSTSLPHNWNWYFEKRGAGEEHPQGLLITWQMGQQMTIDTAVLKRVDSVRFEAYICIVFSLWASGVPHETVYEQNVVDGLAEHQDCLTYCRC